MTVKLDSRFNVVPSIENAGGTQTSQAGAATSTVTGSSVNVPNKPESGLTYRIKVAGTKTGTNAAMKVHVKLGASQVLSLTAPGNTAVDWVAEATIRFETYNVQKVAGYLLSNAAAVVADYAAAAVDCSAGAELLAQIQSQHASDTVTAEIVSIESWVD